MTTPPHIPPANISLENSPIISPAISSIKHPEIDIVSAYAAGALEPAVALVIATHLEMCTDCLAEYEAALTIGGAMLRQLDVPAAAYAAADYGTIAPDFDLLTGFPPEMTSSSNFNTPPSFTANLPAEADTISQQVATSKTALPTVLADFLQSTNQAAITVDPSMANTLATLPWQKRTKNLRIAPFELDGNQGKCNFIELQAGSSLPNHTHKGEEYLIVLTGSLQDEHGTYQPGDLVYADSGVTHTPTAVDTCICLAATTAPVRFTGWKGSVMNMLGMGRL